MEILVILVLSYQYWAAPVALLLNYYLARKLYGLFGKAGTMAWCLVLTLLLMSPISESWGFKSASGVLYLPWFVMLFGSKQGAIHPGGMIVLSIISLVMSFITVDRLVKRANQSELESDQVKESGLL